MDGPEVLGAPIVPAILVGVLLHLQVILSAVVAEISVEEDPLRIGDSYEQKSFYNRKTDT